MFKSMRVFLALLCFAGFALLFLDLSGTLPPSLAFLAKWQLMPALLSGSVAVVLALAGLTLLLGRVYCSVLCPLGVMQDIISRARALVRGRRIFSYRAGKTALRVTVLLLFAVAAAAGVPLVVALLEPFSAFGRVATDVLLPVVTLGNNTLALAAEEMDSMAIAPSPVAHRGWAALWGAVLTLCLVGWLAWKGGRTWCNTLCPVGTLLGLLGRFALLRPRIATDKCVGCGLCARQCKSACIDAEHGIVHASRCVACFNCQDTCRHGALSFLPLGNKGSTQKPPRAAKPDTSRRALLVGLGTSVLAMPAHAAGRGEDAPMAALTRKQRPARSVPLTPPGSVSLKHYTARCTGCQLCVAACPHTVLRSQDSGVSMLQPNLSFEYGFCRVNCVACSTVCPTGAIGPITVEEKSAIQIGRALLTPERCIIHTDKVRCTACARNCPTGAISLVGEGEYKVPAVDRERCTGCGACEYVCPARPAAAIYVEGNLEHRRI